MKILMVCLGNICRSPLAEGILAKQAAENGFAIEVESAGTSAHMPGCAPHKYSQRIAAENGVDISGQQCRQFVAEDFDRFDKIFVMDESNYRNVRKIAGEKWNQHKVDFLMNLVTPNCNQDIPDPWYGNLDGYSKVFDMIDKACKNLVRNLKSELNQSAK